MTIPLLFSVGRRAHEMLNVVSFNSVVTTLSGPKLGAIKKKFKDLTFKDLKKEVVIITLVFDKNKDASLLWKALLGAKIPNLVLLTIPFSTKRYISSWNTWLSLHATREWLFRVNYVLKRLLITFTHKQNSAQTNIKQISPGRTSHSIPLVSLKSIGLKLERCPNFFMFQSTYILPSVRTNERKQFHCWNQKHITPPHVTSSIWGPPPPCKQGVRLH